MSSTSDIGSPLLQRLLSTKDAHDERLATLEETNSFITGTAATPITIGSDWVIISGLVLGPQNYQVASPDLEVATDGASVTVNRGGKYEMSVNCQFVSATADGWFEAAIEPIGVCTPLWPDDNVNKGHRGLFVPQAIFAFPDITPGYAASARAPLCAGDAITASAKFSTADGLGTIDITAVMYAMRFGG